jgi:nitrate/nitrite-specific signal transduction histidine kinase
MTADGGDTREEFLSRFFEEGKNFTKRLLEENAALREAIAGLQAEVAERPGVGETPSDVGAKLRERYTRLLSAYNELREKYGKLERDLNAIKTENVDFAQKYVEIEDQNTALANLYVASFQLHSTLNFDEVVKTVVEIVINLIGAEQLAVFVFDEETERLSCVAYEGVGEDQRRPVVIGEGLAGKVAALGESYYVTDDAGQKDAEGKGRPIACVPLKIKDRLIGIITVHRLFRQKEGFTTVDFQLFDLLAGHAATALYSSKLYALSERKLATARSFLDLLKIKSAGP